MADISVQKKNGPDLTKVWAAAAVLAIIALMGWLMSTQDDARSTVAMPVAEDTVEAPVAESVDLTVLGGAPDQYVDRQILIAGVPVAARLGNRGFWADIPGANPFLVIVDPAVQDVAWIDPGNERTLQGMVRPVTDATLDTWVQSNAIQSDARDQAAFASHYLHVSQVMP